MLTSARTDADRSSLTDSLKSIAWKGRAVVVGFAGGEIEKVLAPQKQLGSILTVSQLPLNLVLLKNIEITGIHWGAYTSAYSLSFDHGNAENAYVSLKVKEPGHILSVYKAVIRQVHTAASAHLLALTLVPASSNLGR